MFTKEICISLNSCNIIIVPILVIYCFVCLCFIIHVHNYVIWENGNKFEPLNHRSISRYRNLLSNVVIDSKLLCLKGWSGISAEFKCCWKGNPTFEITSFVWKQKNKRNIIAKDSNFWSISLTNFHLSASLIFLLYFEYLFIGFGFSFLNNSVIMYIKSVMFGFPPLKKIILNLKGHSATHLGGWLM